MTRVFDFSKTYLLLFFILGFTLIMTDGLQEITWNAVGASLGGAAGLVIFFGCFDWLARHFSLRAFNVFIVGSLIGYFFSWTFISCLDHIIKWTPALIPESKLLSCIKFSLLIFGIYFGISLVSRASDELYMSIPLIRFRFQNNKKKDLLADKNVLLDVRLLDMAGSGILDHRLVVPAYLIKELREALSHQDESLRQKAKKSLDMIANLELLPRLNLRIYEADYPEVSDSIQKLMKVARSIEADILTSSTVDSSSLIQVEDVRFININALSSSIQPSVFTGEQIDIHIRRPGKDLTQGIGFLDDGSMVVVNGAGSYVGQTVTCFILSVKKSMTGRLVFANMVENRVSQAFKATISNLDTTNETDESKAKELQ